MPPTDIGACLSAYWAALSVTPLLLLAYVAGALGVTFAAAGALVRTMIPLRWPALASNLCFLAFGALFPSATTLALAAALLPIDLYRQCEILRLARQVQAAASRGHLSGLWLRPYIKPKTLPAGAVLFRRGDVARRLYLLADGRLELQEIGLEIQPGRLFGEIALFSPSKRRIYSVHFLTACTVRQIHDDTVRQLYL